MIYLELFFRFFQVSCFTFGGAYGAIPLIRDMVLRCGWLTEERLSYMIAVSESTPGPIMVNLATYIGSEQAGFFGSLMIVMALKNAIKNPYVQAVLSGLKPCVVGIVIATGLYMSAESCLGKTSAVDVRALAVALALIGSMLLSPKLTKKKLSPIGLILLSAVLGVLLF